MSDDSPIALLSFPDLCAKLRCRSSKCYELQRLPGFPQPTRELGNPLWIESEVDAWLRERITEERSRLARRPRRSAAARPPAARAQPEPLGRTGSDRTRR